ncbi:MAG: response regulator, partial [Akkermansiaceae bacterium]|nr:response regulator [Akkermansiaceae bacterium]
MGAGRDLSGRRKDGTKIPLEIGLNPVETAEGQHVLASIIDLTERKRAEEELKLSANRLMLAAKAGGIGVWDYDILNNILVWDDDMYRLYGITPQRFSGAYEAWEEGLHPDDLEGEREKLQRAIRGEEEFDTEFRVVWPDDGSVHFIKANATVLRDESGDALRMIGVNWDNTERRRKEDELREAKRAAEAAAEAKSEFLANMSHEIRTPMNGIMGMTELLLGTELEREQREYLGLISNSAESLLTVINDILDFSKIEAGKLQLDRHEFDLRDSVGDTLQTLGVRAAEKGLELAYHVQADVPDCLIGDLGRLRQVLVNLVGNALKFTEKGEVVVDIRIETRTRDDVSLHFLVTDTGIGISPEKRQDIFESFTQAEGSTTRIHGGTGLGLTISRKLVELMQGRLWVESEPGTGSTFHFTVLLGVGSTEHSQFRSAPETLSELPVLVVDDNATNRKFLDEMARSWELAPQSAAGGAEALDMLAAADESGKPFQLVLLDMMMPGMDGLEVARRIKDRFGESSPRILVLSSAGRALGPGQLSGLGIGRSLNKPVKASDLLDAIARLFGTSTRDRIGAEPVVAARPEGVRSMKVLLAEDGRVNQVVATKLLEERGHTVMVANDGQAAVDIHGREPLDAILMDVQMPRLDGYAATRAIREMELKTGAHVPIIAMTANAMKGDREKCLEAGMDDYVAKPVRSTELFSVLEKFAAGDGDHPGGSDNEPHAEPPSGAAGGDNAGVFDPEHFRDEMPNPDIMRELIDLFPEDTGATLAEARRAAADQDAEALHTAAHSLKGTLGNYFAPKAYQAATALDTLARAGDLSHAARALESCEQAVEELHSALRDFRNSLE